MICLLRDLVFFFFCDPVQRFETSQKENRGQKSRHGKKRSILPSSPFSYPTILQMHKNKTEEAAAADVDTRQVQPQTMDRKIVKTLAC